MGDQLLHAGLRRAAVHVRRRRRQDRPQAHAHDRAGAVRHRLAAVGLRADARAAHLRPGRDGPGRRRGHAADAVHHLQRLRAGRTAPRHRPVGHGRRHRRRHRPGARRRAARPLLVGLGLPDQRAGDVIGAIAAAVLVPESRNREAGRIDYVGVLLSIVGPDHCWSTASSRAATPAPGCAWTCSARSRAAWSSSALFAWYEARIAHPSPRRAAVPRPAAVGLGRRDRAGVLRHGRRVLLHQLLPAERPRLQPAGGGPADRAVRGRPAGDVAAQRRPGPHVRRQGGRARSACSS